MNSPEERVHANLVLRVDEAKARIRYVFHRQPRWRARHLHRIINQNRDKDWLNSSIFGIAKFSLMEEGFMHWDNDGFLRPGPHPVDGPLREY